MQLNNPTDRQILFHRKTKEPKLRWNKLWNKAIEIKKKKKTERERLIGGSDERANLHR